MTLGTTLSRITGFIRTAALASLLGLTQQSMADSFNLANITPNMVYDLVLGGIISSLFIPIFVEYLSTKGEEEAWNVANSMFNITLVLLTVVSILLCLGAGALIKAQTFLASGREQMVEDAIFLLRFFIFEIIFYGVCSIYTGILNSFKHFTIPAFAPIANNLIVTASVVVYHFYPSRYVLGIGATLGVVAMAMIQLPWVYRTGFKHKLVADFKHEAIRKLARLAGPVTGYVVINQIGLWVVNILAAQVKGGISAYQYAHIFFQLPYGVLSVSINTALFPTLAKDWVEGNIKKIVNSVSLGIRTTAFVIIPSSVIYAILATPIIRLLLQHLHFGAEDTKMLASVLFYFVLGLIFFCIFMLALKVFYAMQDTKTPMLVAAVIIALNIALDFAYFYIFKSDYMKIAGLALGNTSAYLVGSIWVLAILKKRLGTIDEKRVARSISKIIIASTAMGASCWGTAFLVEKTLGTQSLVAQLLQVFLPIIISLLVYLGASVLLKCEEMDALKRLISRFLKKKQSELEPTPSESIKE